MGIQLRFLFEGQRKQILVSRILLFHHRVVQLTRQLLGLQIRIRGFLTLVLKAPGHPKYSLSHTKQSHKTYKYASLH